MSELYEADYYAWTQEQAQLLKEKGYESLDTLNLIEEIEDLGNSQLQQLENRLEKLLGHLLKWEYQPERRGKSWQSTIKEQRKKIKKLLKKNPSLKPRLEEAIVDGYDSGINLAVRETPFDYDTFPKECPYSQEQIFDDNFPFS